MIQASRKLDVLIAEKVMGYRYEATHRAIGWEPKTGDPVLWSDEYYFRDEFGKPVSYMPYPGRIHEMPVSHYSTNISDAWQVMEKMVSDNSFCLLTTTPDGGWSIQLMEDEDEDRVYADTAPLAICLAALKSKNISLESL